MIPKILHYIWIDEKNPNIVKILDELHMYTIY